MIPVSIALLLFLAAPGAAQTVNKVRSGTAPEADAVEKPRPLGYKESSTGLDYPEWGEGDSELEMGDVNNDGYVDIVSIGDHDSPINGQEHGIMVYFGDGQGSWTAFCDGHFGYGGVALGDVNNDGFMDVGYGMHHDYSGNDFGDQLIEAALGDGTGMNWTPWDDGLATNGETWGMFGTDFADVDCDGDLDLASDSFGAGAGVHVYLNNGDGTWTQSFGFLGGNSYKMIYFGDVNNDGYPDFAVEHQYGTVYLGDGAGGYTLADNNLPATGIMGRGGIHLADVNGDGCDDLSLCTSSGGLEVWLWTASGTWVPASNGLPASSPLFRTQLYDMDGDGKTDLVAYGSGTVVVFLGDGAGNWTADALFETGSPGYCSAFRAGVDADRNGLPDIVCLSEEGGWPNRQNHLRFYKETSIPRLLRVRITEPGGHEVLRRGAVRFIDWCSAVPGGAASAIRLDLSTAGPGGPWDVIADSLPDNGRFQWTVPSQAPQSANCHIRATVTTASGSWSDYNEAPFTIE